MKEPVYLPSLNANHRNLSIWNREFWSSTLESGQAVRIGKRTDILTNRDAQVSRQATVTISLFQTSLSKRTEIPIEWCILNKSPQK
jgi:hypothetical protein